MQIELRSKVKIGITIDGSLRRRCMPAHCSHHAMTNRWSDTVTPFRDIDRPPAGWLSAAVPATACCCWGQLKTASQCMEVIPHHSLMCRHQWWIVLVDNTVRCRYSKWHGRTVLFTPRCGGPSSNDQFALDMSAALWALWKQSSASWRHVCSVQCCTVVKHGQLQNLSLIHISEPTRPY